jgi:membrane protein
MKFIKKLKKNMRNPDSVEIYFFELVKRFVLRFVSAIFLFKKRKGEVLAGATTFFTILSFGPALLVLISAIGAYIGDNDIAKHHVVETIFLSFPKIDPEILKSIKLLVEGQISDTIKPYQMMIWFATCLGISTSFVFGINILSKVDPDGGLFNDDIRSVIFGIFLTLFFFLIFMVLEKQFILTVVETFLTDNKTAVTAIEILLWPLSIITFGLFYKYSAQIEVRMKDALLGGFVFTLCFLIGKSGYWVYLKYFKEELQHDYGNFYNFMVAMIWIYFIICSFYIGASFTYVSKVKVFSRVRK